MTQINGPDVVARYKLLTSDFERGIMRVNSMAKASKEATKTMFGEVNEMAGRAGTAMMVISGATLGLAATGARLAGQWEQTGFAFENMQGSSRATMTMVTNFAVQARQLLLPTLQNAQLLLNSGFKAEGITQALKGITGAAVGSGRGQEALTRIAMAIGQIQAKGKVMGEEMTQQLGELMPAWQILAVQMGKPVAELQKMAQNGQLLAKDAIPALIRGMNERYGGLVDKLGSTLLGKWNNLLNKLQLEAVQGGDKGLLGLAKRAIDTITALVETLEGVDSRIIAWGAGITFVGGAALKGAVGLASFVANLKTLSIASTVKRVADAKELSGEVGKQAAIRSTNEALREEAVILDGIVISEQMFTRSVWESVLALEAQQRAMLTGNAFMGVHLGPSQPRPLPGPVAGASAAAPSVPRPAIPLALPEPVIESTARHVGKLEQVFLRLRTTITGVGRTLSTAFLAGNAMGSLTKGATAATTAGSKLWAVLKGIGTYIVGVLLTALRSIATVLGFLLSPIGLIIAAVTAIISVTGYWIYTNRQLKKSLEENGHAWEGFAALYKFAQRKTSILGTVKIDTSDITAVRAEIQRLQAEEQRLEKSMINEKSRTALQEDQKLLDAIQRRIGQLQSILPDTSTYDDLTRKGGEIWKVSKDGYRAVWTIEQDISRLHKQMARESDGTERKRIENTIAQKETEAEYLEWRNQQEQQWILKVNQAKSDDEKKRLQTQMDTTLAWNDTVHKSRMDNLQAEGDEALKQIERQKQGYQSLLNLVLNSRLFHNQQYTQGLMDALTLGTLGNPANRLPVPAMAGAGGMNISVSGDFTVRTVKGEVVEIVDQHMQERNRTIQHALATGRGH